MEGLMAEFFLHFYRAKAELLVITARNLEILLKLFYFLKS